MNQSELCRVVSNYSISAYCKPYFDGELCWNATAPGTNASQHCPAMKGVDSTKFAWRYCNDNGSWYHNDKLELIDKGYTYFNDCYTPQMKVMIEMCGRIDCMKVAQNTRAMEMVGLSLSLITLTLSLIIFYKYRILRNNRTTIHKNLFIATLLQVVVRLIIYIDQIENVEFLESVAYLCETCVVILEFTKMSTITWMFIEGLYLHNAITVTVFQEHSYIKLYCYIGWIAPQVLTVIWVITMVVIKTDKCFFLYNFLPNYWIIEGPSTLLMVVNMLFLLNIIRILVMKLRESCIGEIQQIRKAVRAAVFLVPLMGTANVLFMVDYRTFKEFWILALWSYITYFLNSFQGFFVAILYCFLNGEVREAMKNSFSLYMSLRHDNMANRRNSIEDTRLTAETEP